MNFGGIGKACERETSFDCPQVADRGDSTRIIRVEGPTMSPFILSSPRRNGLAR
jgi:hypothetical protein